MNLRKLKNLGKFRPFFQSVCILFDFLVILSCEPGGKNKGNGSSTDAGQSSAGTFVSPLSVGKVKISPTSPTIASMLECTGTPHGVRESAPNLTYQWKKNGNILSDKSAATLTVAGHAQKNDVIRCVILASDGSRVSEAAESEEIVILNTAPFQGINPSTNQAVKVLTLPAEPTSMTGISCTAEDFSDADGDSLKIEYRWKRNGVEIPEQTSASMGYSVLSQFEPESALVCEARAFDGMGASEWVASEPSPLRSNMFFQEAFVKAPNAEENDFFGQTLAISGDTLAVGAASEDSSQNVITNRAQAVTEAVGLENGASESGAVYIYRRRKAENLSSEGDIWTLDAFIKASNSNSADRFGAAVALDRSVLAVGAPAEDSSQSTITNAATVSSNESAQASADNSVSNSGAVYLFERVDSNWIQKAFIKSVNRDAQDLFGTSLALSGDTLAASSVGESSNQSVITNGLSASSDNSLAASGAVYVYRKIEGQWAQEAYLKAANRSAGDTFGYSVSLSGDTLAVGSPKEDSGQSVILSGSAASADDLSRDSGAVYVYRRSGTEWSAEAYVKASNNSALARFGEIVSLSGNQLAVGASGNSTRQTVITAITDMANTVQNTEAASPTIDDSAAGFSGAVFIFARTGSAWRAEAFVKPSNNETEDYFGKAVALQGGTLAVGAYGEDSNQIVITNTTNSASSDNSTSAAGAVYVFRKHDDKWKQVAYIKPSENTQGNNFGASLALDGDTLAVGSTGDDSASKVVTNTTGGMPLPSSVRDADRAINSGAVFIFRNKDVLFSPRVQVVSKTHRTMTFGWDSSLGKAASVVVSPAVTGIAEPPTCDAEGAQKIEPGVFSYTYKGLVPATKYTFRFCPASTGSEARLGDLYESKYGFVLSAETDRQLGWVQEAYLKASNSEAGDFFGSSVSLSGDTVAVGVSREDSNQDTITNGVTSSSDNSKTDSGAVYIFRQTGSNWAQEAYIKALNVGSLDAFGGSVSLSGDSLAVGTARESSNQVTISNGSYADTDNSSFGAGAVYVYSRTAGIWAQQAYIKAANADGADYFGSSVALNGDLLAAGAVGEDSNANTITNGSGASSDNSSGGSGAVYIFGRSGSSWTQEAYVKPTNSNAGDAFGSQLALHGDTVAISAPRESSRQSTITNFANNSSAAQNAGADQDLLNSGAVYVFRKQAASWVQEAYIKPSNPDENDLFGMSVSLNGELLAVGASDEDGGLGVITQDPLANELLDDSAGSAGAVYLFRRSGGAQMGAWAQEAYVKAPIAERADRFGVSVAVSGSTVAIGAEGESANQTTITDSDETSAREASQDNSLSNSGAVYMFRKAGATWIQEAYVKPSNAGTEDFFGTSLSLSADTLAVGARGEASNLSTVTNGIQASSVDSAPKAGAVYIFRNPDRAFDPDIRVTAVTASSVSFEWASRLGSATQVTVAPASAHTTQPPACDAPGALTLAAGTTSYTYSSLSSATKYGFRFCSTQSTAGQTQFGSGVTVWSETN